MISFDIICACGEALEWRGRARALETPDMTGDEPVRKPFVLVEIWFEWGNRSNDGYYFGRGYLNVDLN